MYDDGVVALKPREVFAETLAFDPVGLAAPASDVFSRD